MKLFIYLFIYLGFWGGKFSCKLDFECFLLVVLTIVKRFLTRLKSWYKSHKIIAIFVTLCTNMVERSAWSTTISRRHDFFSFLNTCHLSTTAFKSKLLYFRFIFLIAINSVITTSCPIRQHLTFMLILFIFSLSWWTINCIYILAFRISLIDTYYVYIYILHFLAPSYAEQ